MKKLHLPLVVITLLALYFAAYVWLHVPISTLPRP